MALTYRKWNTLRQAQLAGMPRFVDHKWSVWPSDDEVSNDDYHLFLFMGMIPVVWSTNIAQNMKLLSEQPKNVEVGGHSSQICRCLACTISLSNYSDLKFRGLTL